MSKNDIVSRIVAKFRKLEGEAPDLGKPEWTTEVKATLCRLGKDESYTTWATGVPDDCQDGAEFLYDVCWLKTDNRDRTINCALVAECEWGDRGEVEYDFQKLLLARSGVRVLVYDTKQASGDQLREHVEVFAGAAGDTYLLIGWVEEGAGGFRFRFELITDEGPGTPPKLEAV